MSDENNYRKKKSVTERGVGRSNALSALGLPDPLQCGLVIVGGIMNISMLTGILDLNLKFGDITADDVDAKNVVVSGNTTLRGTVTVSGRTSLVDVQCSGNATFNGGIYSPALGTQFQTITADAPFTALINITYLITTTLTANRIITLPSPVTVAGTTIRFVLGADLANGFTWTIGQGTALGAVPFSVGSALNINQAGATHAAANNAVNIVGVTNGGGGVGSTVVLTSTGTAWYLHGELWPQGDGTAPNTSAFATVV